MTMVTFEDGFGILEKEGPKLISHKLDLRLLGRFNILIEMLQDQIFTRGFHNHLNSVFGRDDVLTVLEELLEFHLEGVAAHLPVSGFILGLISNLCSDRDSK